MHFLKVLLRSLCFAGRPAAGDGFFWHCQLAQVPASSPAGVQVQDEQEDDCHLILVLCLLQRGVWAGHHGCDKCGLCQTSVGLQDLRVREITV